MHNKVDLHTTADMYHLVTEMAHRKQREDASPEKKLFQAALIAMVMDHGAMVAALKGCGIAVTDMVQVTPLSAQRLETHQGEEHARDAT